ncbi:ABC transporter permease, partial [Lactobacillus sp. XV13L]|nr:ABC transporter permease [Lactobacillus sp. XV13L]
SPQRRQNFIKENRRKVDIDQNVKPAAAAEKRVTAEKLDGYLVLDLKQNRVRATYHGVGAVDEELKAQFLRYTQKLQGQLNLQGARLAPKQAQALAQRPQYKEVLHKADGKGDDKAGQYISLVLLLFMSYMILLLYSSITAQEIAAEKGSKIMEIIFSSTTAAKYFLGKI